jgi:pullulanase
MRSDLLDRKVTHFVLWRPRNTNPPPKLVIGKFQPGNPPSLADQKTVDLRPSEEGHELWEIPVAECGLANGEVFHYWFEVTDANPFTDDHPRMLCTDPTIWTVDWRLRATQLTPRFREDHEYPAGVVKHQDGRLAPCDPGGELASFDGDAFLGDLPTNNHLVIYELPTTWSKLSSLGAPVQIGVGTFRDVTALIVREAAPANFSGVAALERGRAHLVDLGVNALELLPPADSFVSREWGYATSNYFAPDFDLGLPEDFLTPTAASDLARLVTHCHQKTIRFFIDVVMAFANRAPYRNINFLDFHVQPGTGDPEEFDKGVRRDAFGGELFKYNFRVQTYDPVSGDQRDVVPARQLMLTHLDRWMLDFRIDGIRMDSVNNIANWDFVQEFKDRARSVWQSRAAEQGLTGQRADERFLVVGEELSVPIDLLTQRRLDGLWNEGFKRRVRCAILGQSLDGESFETTVRRLIDCREVGFRDGAQAINYVTSHDVGGFRNERLYNFLNNNGIVETEQRIKLAFVCLLTAVGIPMILAGEEFADQHDLPVTDTNKQLDPVNYDRVDEPFRKRIVEYVSRLVKFRTTSEALGLNDTRFIHVDFNDGKRVLVWQRGREGSDELVVVVANFSGFGTPDPFNPASEYVVPGFPGTPAGRRWREITLDRDVPQASIGREPIFPWEAKVYALVPSS